MRRSASDSRSEGQRPPGPCLSFHSLDVIQSCSRGNPSRTRPISVFVAVDGRTVEMSVADLQGAAHGLRDLSAGHPVRAESAQSYGGHQSAPV